MISQYLGFDSDYIILGLAGFCIVLFILVIVNMVQTSKMKKKYKKFMSGKNAKSLEETLVKKLNQIDSLVEANAANEKNIKNYMVVTFDLNNLKMCNDNYGHSSGDAYIIHSAHIIETTFDRFGKCYRIGGDEFCCLIPDAAEFQIERFIQKMQQDIAILNNKNIIPTEVGIACGYALATPDDADIEKVRERADEMMYHNKKVLKGLI